jgi:hypothetical protein
MAPRHRSLRRKCSAKHLPPGPHPNGVKRLRPGPHPSSARRGAFKNPVGRHRRVSSGQPRLHKSRLHKSRRNEKSEAAPSRARKDGLHPRQPSSAVSRPLSVVLHLLSVVSHRSSAARRHRLSAGPLPKRVPSVVSRLAMVGRPRASARSTVGARSIVRLNIMTTAAIGRARAILFSLVGRA